MNKYNDLELSILSCLLQRPELMNKLVLQNEHFINHQKMFIFMKAFYKKFGNFDLTLMMSVSKNKYRIIEYMMLLIEKEPAPSLFETYQKQLIELYKESKKEKYIREKVYELANDLFIKDVEVNDFRNKVDEIYNNAKIMFEKEEN